MHVFSQNPALSVYSFRLRQEMPDAQLGRRFIATAFILEIPTAIYPTILFGDLRLMDLSWHGSHEKTVTSSRNATTPRSSIRLLTIWRPIASSDGWRALLSSDHVRLAIAASLRRLIRLRCAIASTAKSNTASRFALSHLSSPSKWQHAISIFRLAARAWHVSCRASFPFGANGARGYRQSHMSMEPLESRCWSQRCRHACMHYWRHTGNAPGYRCCSIPRSIWRENRLSIVQLKGTQHFCAAKSMFWSPEGLEW